MISIIVPVYNAENYIDRCIESLINQTYKEIEILAVNDGSTDASGEKLRKWAESDGRLHIFDKPNGGVSSARNMGLENASGEYVMFADADDYAAPSICEKLLKTAEKYCADLTLCGICIKSGSQDSINLPQIDMSADFGTNFAMLREKGLINPPWAKLYKRNEIKARFNTSSTYGEDLEFNLEYLEQHQKMASCDEALYFYDVSVPGSLCKNLEKNVTAHIRMNRLVEDFIKRHNIEYPSFVRSYYRSFRSTIEDAVTAGYSYKQLKKLFGRLCGEGGYKELAKEKKTPGILNKITRLSILLNFPLLIVSAGWAELKIR